MGESDKKGIPNFGPVPGPTDRHFLIALMRLIGALAERLTGEVPVVRVENERGDFVWTRPSTCHVRWEKSLPAADGEAGRLGSG